jgi:type I restriction enzyme S subunit
LSSQFESFKLKDIATIFSGNSINEKVKEKKFTGIDNGVNYISTKDIGFDSKINYKNGVTIPLSELNNFKKAPKNTIFICAEGGSAGRKIAISDEELCFVNKLFAVVASNKVLPKYLFYSLKSEDFIEQFRGSMTGIIGGVSLNKFKELEVKVPSISAQQKIVLKLDAIFAEIDKVMLTVEANAKNAEALFQSYLTEVFEKIKSESTFLKLSELANFRNGINFRSSSSGIPTKIFGVKNFKNLFFAPTDALDEINLEKNVPKDDLIQTNDILFVRSNGNPELIGRCVLFDNVVDEITFSGFTIRCRLVTTKVHPKFLMYFLKSEKTRRIMIDGGNGANIKSLNQTTLGSLDIPIPANLNIQKQIILKFEKLEGESVKLLNSYKSKRLNLEIYKDSILRKAFNGDLVKE